jgi:hypothetical protein
MLFDVDDFFVFAEEDKIDGKEHTYGMDAAGRHNPETTAELRPAASLSKQTDQSTKIAVG